MLKKVHAHSDELSCFSPFHTHQKGIARDVWECYDMLRESRDPWCYDEDMDGHGCIGSNQTSHGRWFCWGLHCFPHCCCLHCVLYASGVCHRLLGEQQRTSVGRDIFFSTTHKLSLAGTFGDDSECWATKCILFVSLSLNRRFAWDAICNHGHVCPGGNLALHTSFESWRRRLSECRVP